MYNTYIMFAKKPVFENIHFNHSNFQSTNNTQDSTLKIQKPLFMYIYN